MTQLYDYTKIDQAKYEVFGGRLIGRKRLCAQLGWAVFALHKSPRELYALMERERRSYDYYGQFPANLWEPIVSVEGMSDEAFAGMWGLLSLSRDGYKRENALKVFEKKPVGTLLPYVIMRLADWVAPVAEKARALFPAVVKDASLDDWQAASTVLLRIKAWKGGRAIYQACVRILKDSYNIEARLAYLGTAHPDFQKVLWDCAEPEFFQSEEALKALRKDMRPVLAEWGFAKMLKGPLRDMALSVAMTHPQMRIRKLALSHLYRHDSSELRHITEQALVDKSASLRDYARWIYKNRFDASAREFIRAQTLAGESLNNPTRYQLAWLETADGNDLVRVEQILKQTKRGRVRAAALKAYAWLKGPTDGAENIVVWALGQGAATRNAAGGLIASGWAGPLSQTLWTLVESARSPQDMVGLMDIAAKANRAQSLIPALKLYNHENERVRKYAKRLVEKWQKAPAPFPLSEAEQKEALALVKAMPSYARAEEELTWFLSNHPTQSTK